MKLKKLVKKILKEKKGMGGGTLYGPRKEGTAHLYSGCMLSNSTAGFDYDGPSNMAPWAYGNLFSTGVITQYNGPGHSSGQQGYLSEFEDLEVLEGMDLAAGIINNNNIIHDMWGLTSPGQIVKFHVSPIFVNMANPISNAPNYGTINRGVCMKYEGPVGVGFNTLDNYNPSSGFSGTLSEYPINTYPHFSTLDVVVGTFSSCEECEQFANGGLPLIDETGPIYFDPDACNYNIGNAPCYFPGTTCVHQMIPGEYVNGSYVEPYPVYGTYEGGGGSCECIPNDTQDLPTNDDSDKDPQVSRMQDLANIKPKNLKKL